MDLKDVLKNKVVIITLMAVILIIGILITVVIDYIIGKPTVEAVELENTELTNEVEENVLVVSIEQLEEIEEEIEEEMIEEENVATEVKKETSSQTTPKSQKSVLTGYYIKVNNLANTVTIYKYNSEGELEPVKAMICSTGGATPKSGKYSLKSRWEWLGLFGNVYGHYVTQITGNILFHSVPYLRKGDPASLEYWEFDKLGTSASMGCVRLQIKDSKWIFDNCKSGTIVEFYSDSNPGPLGKPSAPQISSNELCRNWDPTDPNSSNPWKNANNIVTSNDNIGDDSEAEKQIQDIIKNSQKTNTIQNNVNTTNTTNTNTTNSTNTINNENQNKVEENNNTNTQTKPKTNKTNTENVKQNTTTKTNTTNNTTTTNTGV